MRAFLPIAACAVMIACGGGTGAPTAPTTTATTPPPTASAPAPAPTPALNLSGTWTGTVRAAGRPNHVVLIKSWIATQTGANVAGPVVIDVGEGTLVNAAFTGTVSGAQLSSVSFTVAAGAIRELPACSFSGIGTQTASATAISGTMAMTFAAPCVGPDLASLTPTDTWTFSLTK